MNIKQSTGMGVCTAEGSRVVGAMLVVSAVSLMPGQGEDQQRRLGFRSGQGLP